MITDKKARSIKPTDTTIPSGIAGLVLKATKTKGRGQWQFRYQSPATGKRRLSSFGVYPDVPVADALEQARDARKMLAAGVDPIEKKKEQAAIPTFEQVARDYWAELRPTLRQTRQTDKWFRLLELYAFPAIGNRRVDSLKPRDFADMLAPIWNTKSETARKVKQRCHKVMAICWAREQTDNNPVDVAHLILPKQNDKVTHQPAMPWQQVPAFVAEQLSHQPLLGSRAALLFAILTAARSGEVRGAIWQEIDLERRLWTVPASRMKAAEEHRVPLSSAAVGLLEQLPYDRRPDDIVFPAIRAGMLSDTAITMLLRKANATSDTAGRVATLHGFRSSFRNWAADNHYQSDIAERALAHVIGNAVRRAYEKTDLLSARVEMMEQWAQHVMSKATIRSATA